MKHVIHLLLALTISISSNAQKSDPWTEYMTPNDIHKMLLGYAGEFDLKISMWMSDGKEPTIIDITCTNKMILGNRFLEMRQSGQMMGMNYEAVSTIGYNTISKLVSLTTLTNMGTGTLYLTGPWFAGKSIATLSGQITNPMDGKQIHVRQEISCIDKDNLLIRNFDTYDGETEKLSIEYRWIRKK